MSRTKRTLTISSHLIMLGLILWQVVPMPAHAYLDPGMGSSIIQIIIAALATGSYLVKVFWKQISGFFGGIFGGKKPSKSHETAEKKDKSAK